MQKTNTAVEEIRNIAGKLVAKYYMKNGVIEIKQGEYIVQIHIPPRTMIRVLSGKKHAAK
ncbi:MAG: hypothetical protein K2K46_13065 [Lachnospiraceae bacterium]|nr:hypothetical protein [Lachnospiraceae bacterium]